MQLFSFFSPMENTKHFCERGDEPLQPSAEITKHRSLGGHRAGWALCWRWHYLCISHVCLVGVGISVVSSSRELNKIKARTSQGPDSYPGEEAKRQRYEMMSFFVLLLGKLVF